MAGTADGDVGGDDIYELPDSSHPISERDDVFLKNGVISFRNFTEIID